MFWNTFKKTEYSFLSVAVFQNIPFLWLQQPYLNVLLGYRRIWVLSFIHRSATSVAFPSVPKQLPTVPMFGKAQTGCLGLVVLGSWLLSKQHMITENHVQPIHACHHLLLSHCWSSIFYMECWPLRHSARVEIAIAIPELPPFSTYPAICCCFVFQRKSTRVQRHTLWQKTATHRKTSAPTAACCCHTSCLTTSSGLNSS